MRETFQSWLDSRGPQGVHSARLTATSATSALCPDDESPSDSGLATLLHCRESRVPVLICSAQKCPFRTAPKGIGQCSARKRRYQATQFKETEDSRCLGEKKPMPLRVEHKRRMGAGERLAAGPSERSCPLPASKLTTCIQPVAYLSCVPATVPSRTAWRSAEILSFSFVFPKDKADSGEVGFPWAR